MKHGTNHDIARLVCLQMSSSSTYDADAFFSCRRCSDAHDGCHIIPVRIRPCAVDCNLQSGLTAGEKAFPVSGKTQYAVNKNLLN